MKSFQSNHLLLFIYWLLLFITGKAIFLLYHNALTAKLSTGEIAKVFFYGLKLDFSAAGYLSVFPFFVLIFASLLPVNFTRRLLQGYAIIFTFIICLLQTVDLQLYRVWGFKLDATPLQYLNTPAEMLASSAAAPLVLLSVLFLFQFSLFTFLYFRFFQPAIKFHKPDFRHLSISFFLLIILILPIRGGWQQIPVNQSDVYFSEKLFANHAAVNVPWNVIYSLTKADFKEQNPYEFLPETEAEKLVSELYAPAPGQTERILNTKKPNVLFIILESYTAKLVGSLGGRKDVTPELDKIAAEGLIFTNFYANGDRSEKGLVALLSGYPVQSRTSIIKTPRKTEKLPHLSNTFKKAGYYTSYYYGGELAFANIKSYLLTAGYDRLIGKADFPAQNYNSKWGVHDHILLERVQKDLKKTKAPFFTTVFTLSSHEPYTVPMKTKFVGEADSTKFKNSVYYTDKAIGDFMRIAKKQTWWKNTLVVLVADHGHMLPNGDEQDVPSKFRIPLIFTGGALQKTGSRNSLIGSQNDLAYSLLNQLNLPNQDFKWSKDLFNPQAKPFAFYVFNDGFGFVSDSSAYSFDNVSKQIIRNNGTVTEESLKTGKAYMQHSTTDYLKK